MIQFGRTGSGPYRSDRRREWAELSINPSGGRTSGRGTEV